MRRGALLLAILAGTPAPSHAKPLPRYGTFVYSDLCWEKESGDASGARFELTRTRAGIRLTFEYGAGPLEGARIMSLRIHGNRFEAEASTSDGDLKLSATLGARKATLLELFDVQKDQAPQPRDLRRIRRFRQTIPVCR